MSVYVDNMAAEFAATGRPDRKKYIMCHMIADTGQADDEPLHTISAQGQHFAELCRHDDQKRPAKKGLTPRE